MEVSKSPYAIIVHYNKGKYVQLFHQRGLYSICLRSILQYAQSKFSEALGIKLRECNQNPVEEATWPLCTSRDEFKMATDAFLS